jgi:hypothetical protein
MAIQFYLKALAGYDGKPVVREMYAFNTGEMRYDASAGALVGAREDRGFVDDDIRRENATEYRAFRASVDQDQEKAYQLAIEDFEKEKPAPELAESAQLMERGRPGYEAQPLPAPLATRGSVVEAPEVAEKTRELGNQDSDKDGLADDQDPDAQEERDAAYSEVSGNGSDSYGSEDNSNEEEESEDGSLTKAVKRAARKVGLKK